MEAFDMVYLVWIGFDWTVQCSLLCAHHKACTRHESVADEKEDEIKRGGAFIHQAFFVCQIDLWLTNVLPLIATIYFVAIFVIGFDIKWVKQTMYIEHGVEHSITILS